MLGNGFDIIDLGSKSMIRSVPCELNQDHTMVLLAAQGTGYVSAADLRSKHSWSDERIGSVLRVLLEEGIAWVDDHNGDRLYWFPSLSGALGAVG